MSYRDKLYGQYRATHLKAQQPLTQAARRYEVRVLAKTFGPLLPADKSAAIFDLGCGAGSFLRFLQEAGYRRASGMDHDPGSIAEARRLGVEAVHGDALEHLASRPGHYDCVAAIDVIEHFKKEELFDVAGTVHAALKPGGVFLWRSPNADGLFGARVRYGDLTHELAFTKESAWQFMRAADFSDVEIFPEEPLVTGARSLVRQVLWRFFKLGAKAYLFAESYAHEGCLLTANLIVRARKPASA